MTPKQTLHAVGKMEMLKKMENLKGQQEQKSLSENRLNTKTNTFRGLEEQLAAKGQLISKGHFCVFKSTKKTTKFLQGFLP
jgi:hypothetical protein